MKLEEITKDTILVCLPNLAVSATVTFTDMHEIPALDDGGYPNWFIV